MEALLKNMDFLIRHWAPAPRRFPFHLRVDTVGYIARKDHWIRHAFPGCNFSFILSGAGTCRLNGQEWKVEPPCVLMQWPGVFIEYGPEAGGSWEELYLVYPAAAAAAIRRLGIHYEEKPYWKVRAAGALQDLVGRLARLAEDPMGEGDADRVDRLCEQMVVESRLGEWGAEPDAARRTIADIQRKVAEDFRKLPDWDALALARGLSPATFRRRWAEVVGEPPARYRDRLRLREARRLLAETERDVQEVAAACGYDDPLYFSRRFRAATGCSPRAYRRRHRRSLGLE